MQHIILAVWVKNFDLDKNLLYAATMRLSGLSLLSCSFLTFALTVPMACSKAPATSSNASESTESTSETTTTTETSPTSSSTPTSSTGNETSTGTSEHTSSSTGQDTSSSSHTTSGEESTGTSTTSGTTDEMTTNDTSTGNECVDYDPQMCCDDDGLEIIKCSGNNVMEDFGAACQTDADCSGNEYKCINNVLDGAYSLPGGYCTKDCTVADNANTYYEANDPDCGGGASCIGVNNLFTACAIPCQSNDDCWREGYECRFLPVVGMGDDPKFCLMPDKCNTDPMQFEACS